jgi:ribulose 1,5-bisphosphate synthetase/thiazole synthase
MDRRKFSRNMLMAGLTVPAINLASGTEVIKGFREEENNKLPVREFDVIIAGAGTAGVVAAVASARQGAKTAIIETKGYPGGTVVEGGTALSLISGRLFPGSRSVR